MKNTRIWVIALSLIMLVLLVLHLQLTQEYLFSFRETLMVFYYDTSIIASRYLGVGGLGLMLSHWLTQFFIVKYVGAIVTAFLGVLSALMIWTSMSGQRKSIILLPLCVLPFIFQCHALFDIYYSYEGVVDFFLFALFAFLFRCIACRTSHSVWKVVWASLLSLLLFYVAGAVGFLLALYLFVTEIVDRQLKGLYFLIPIALILTVSAICISRGIVPRWRDAITNAAYYEPILTATNFFYTSWVLVLILPLLMPLLNSLQARLKPLFIVLCSFALLVLVSVFSVSSANRNQQKMYPMIAMDHFIRKHDWEGMLQLPACQSSNFLLTNRVNLALSHTGRLLDDFFMYPLVAPYSLLADLDQLALDVEITTTLSEIYWQMDNIASADEKAFNGYEGLRYGSPINLQMLVRTSIVFARYQVAEKLIKMLEKTLFYKDWATSQRRFLYNDKAVEADPEYGEKRRSLPKEKMEFVQAKGPYYDLLQTIRANPKAKAARDYAIGYLLLANDIPHINAFIEEFYGTPVMPTLPLRLQEAAVATHETDLDWCRSHGVDEKVIQNYKTLRKALVSSQTTGISSQGVLGQWRDTYWYYLLVTSPRLANIRAAQLQRQQAAGQNQVSAH